MSDGDYAARPMTRCIGLVVLALLTDCKSTSSTNPQETGPALLPGELCEPATSSTPIELHFDPPRVVVAPGRARPVRMIVNPDMCAPTQATFTSASDAIALAPAPAQLDLRHATYDFAVSGIATGTTTLTAAFPSPVDGSPVSSTLEVEVRDPAPATCGAQDGVAQNLDAQHLAVAGTGKLGSAAMTVPSAAFTTQDELAIAPFPGEVQCASDTSAGAPGSPLALGPAVSFIAHAPVSMAKPLRRELDFSIPVNPAAMPDAARLRHVQALFSSPRAKTPRVVPVSDPRIEKAGDGYVFRFSSPWIGTYQAVVVPDAGTHHRTRHLTHRAIAGVSMGALGASTFGLRHHDQFDALVPMGGPADWTWLVWYIENYLLAGFCPDSKPDCQKYAPNLYPIDEPIVHTMDFNHFWYQTGGGNGGSFPRSEYLQIFQDLAVMAGNANGENDDPNLWFFPRGPKATDPWVRGDTKGMPPGVDCRITVDPIKDDPGQAQQQQFQNQCNAFRCAVDANGRMVNGYVAPSGYFDGKYNPDGKYPVISFCDGGQNGQSPYVDTWQAPTPDVAVPVTVALAVDKNGNGVRDGDEPVIAQGHEPWDDVGVDGLADAQEPGYDALTNPDPNQDDYDFVINPNGSEGNHHYDAGEPFQDVGLDGVPNTASRNVVGDVGENDGKFTMSSGLQGFYRADAYGMIRQWVDGLPAGPLTDEALSRLDILSDGGVRDLFNFVAATHHVEGAIAGRTRPDGTRLRTTAFYNGFDYFPGQTIGKPLDYLPANNVWADIADMPALRYGKVDATPQDIQRGDGQHVGSGDQILHRIQTAFFFVSKGWPDADRTRSEETGENPETATINELGTDCEINGGRCEKMFTGPKTGRTGPIVVSLPPGYALEENRLRDARYPVLYVLHGYGQDPRDLEAVAILTTNFMNAGERSYATRLAKIIVVYVDGRCRVAANGAPECVRGTFWEESPRNDGPHMDSWFMEVVDYVDKNYRTMRPSDVDVTD
jgi:hypothetical protein